jgi:nucleotide-binding universal stress UspA family protein
MTKENKHFIVVGVDGSPPSIDALRWAAHQAEISGESLVVAMAWHIPAAAMGPAPIPNGYDWSVDTAKILHDTITEALGDDPKIAVHPVVLHGPTALELLRASEGADLLVVGSRGHGAFAGMLLGSVSQHCVTHATCPVVVVHPRRAC